MVVERARGFEGDNSGRRVAAVPVFDRGLLLAERLSGGHVCDELDARSVCEDTRIPVLSFKYKLLQGRLELSQWLSLAYTSL